MSWAPHGQWRIRALEQVLVFEAVGAWNEQGTTLFRKATRAATVDLVGAPWGIFGNLLDWGLATPEAIDLIRASTSEAAASGCVVETVVFSGNDLMRHCIDRMLPDNLPNFERVLADSFDEALAALAAHGFAAAAETIAQRGFEAVISEGVAERLGA